MLRFLEAGLVAGVRQLVAVIFITLIAFLAAPERIVVENPSALLIDSGVSRSVSAILTWACLLTATGLALTRDQTVILTAERIRHATRLLGWEKGSKVLAGQLVIAAIVFALFALRPPPHLLIDICRYSGCVFAAPLVWIGMMTTGVACFGASAHAAIRAH